MPIVYVSEREGSSKSLKEQCMGNISSSHVGFQYSYYDATKGFRITGLYVGNPPAKTTGFSSQRDSDRVLGFHCC